MSTYQTIVGDCLDSVRSMADNSVDSIVTDPPYELGFMGKAWDATGIANNVEMWREALRVLKPGGHLLAFSGSRTYHRMTCAIEDAGFEVRDQIMWVYGSGFPKSLDVSKAIDRTGGASVAWFGPWFRKWREERGTTQKEVAALFPSKTGGLTGCVANWELGLNMPTPEQFNLIRDTFGLPFDSIAAAEREVLGIRSGTKLAVAPGQENDRGATQLSITGAGSDAARQWEGWGTALKPAHEPICVARKPLIGTVAANVLAHGTGALNIDGCRVGDEVRFNAPAGNVAGGNSLNMSAVGMPQDAEGRWPANLIHDGSDEALAAFPDAKGQQGALTGNEPSARPGAANCYGAMDRGHTSTPRVELDTSAARFFYCAKCSKTDRNSGLDGLVEVIIEWNDSTTGEIKWGTEARQVKLWVATGQSAPRVTAVFGAPNRSVTEWNTMLSGSASTGLSPQDSTCTTSTKTSCTTPSEILNFFQSCITSGNTADANCAMASGGNPAANAGSCSALMLTTNEWMVSALDASRAVWPMRLKLSASAATSGHPTVKPTALMAYLVRLVTPPGGLVLDPFMGSGSTGKACMREGFRFIGCEISAEYAAIAEARIFQEMCLAYARPGKAV